MSDLLSASSLLMAIAAILFSLWYAEIAKALETAPRPYKEDNVAARKIVTSVLLAKALPVAIMALAVAIIFTPDAFKLGTESFLAYRRSGYAALEKYDAVRTAYCLVTILSAALAIYMWALVAKLWLLRKQLS
ncbi:hypothetical protein [Aromatoleum tolulyticum]|uniref:hypothetical protein n=1 Tax=Aromatoleum tolulyticum TaxID=34027 RepID=UPI000970C60D|nr:hypothetical protein [Aromatoleum tolulyticum]